MSQLEVLDLRASYDGRPILHGIDLKVPASELHAVLGPSGCGKSTLLRCIAGLKPPSSGRILVDGKDVTDLPPERRGVAMLHQEDTLFPHMDVGRNVAFGLKRLGREDRLRRVRELLELVGLPGRQARRPHELSGGERQRVALARALAVGPAVLLLDEPLSHLDQPLRASLRVELRQILRDAGATTLHVTHEREEAFVLADHVILLDEGRVVDAGTPDRIHDRPSSSHAARLLGRRNIVPYELDESGLAQTAIGPIPAPPGTPPQGELLLLEEEVAVRPDGPGAPGRVHSVEYLGGRYRIRLDVQGLGLWAEQVESHVRRGDEARLDLTRVRPLAWPRTP